MNRHCEELPEAATKQSDALRHPERSNGLMAGSAKDLVLRFFGLRPQNDTFGISALVACLFLLSGCALFLVGAGVGGGIAISRDTIEGHFDKSLDQVWKASREVLMQEGFIRLEDRAHGQIEGEVKKSDVKIEAFQVSEKTVRVRVKARKSYKLIPNIDLANELYNKIFHKLE